MCLFSVLFYDGRNTGHSGPTSLLLSHEPLCDSWHRGLKLSDNLADFEVEYFGFSVSGETGVMLRHVLSQFFPNSHSSFLRVNPEIYTRLLQEIIRMDSAPLGLSRR